MPAPLHLTVGVHDDDYIEAVESGQELQSYETKADGFIVIALHDDGEGGLGVTHEILGTPALPSKDHVELFALMYLADMMRQHEGLSEDIRSMLTMLLQRLGKRL